MTCPLQWFNSCCFFKFKHVQTQNFTYLHEINYSSQFSNVALKIIKELCTYIDIFWAVKRFEPHVQAVNSVELNSQIEPETVL